MAIEVQIKQWGNSLGIIIPKEELEKKKLKKGDKISIDVTKKADLSHLFGSLKTKISAQEFKDEARAGWEK